MEVVSDLTKNGSSQKDWLMGLSAASSGLGFVVVSVGKVGERERDKRRRESQL